MIPLGLAIAGILLCSLLALFIGMCLRPAPPVSEDFKTVAIEALRKLDQIDAPKLLEWSPEVRRRLWLQEQEKHNA